MKKWQHLFRGRHQNLPELIASPLCRPTHRHLRRRRQLRRDLQMERSPLNVLQASERQGRFLRHHQKPTGPGQPGLQSNKINKQAGQLR